MQNIRQSFISIIGVLQTPYEVRLLPAWLTSLFGELEAGFSHFEFVLVNNGSALEAIEAVIKPLPEAIRENIFLLQLSTPVNRDNAILAGLDRANGDYTAIFDFDFAQKTELISEMWDLAQQGYDMVYLRAKQRRLPISQRLLYRLFYGIFQRYSDLRIDPWAHHTRLISRRALNSLLRLRENSRYLKANYALVGYANASIQVTEPLHPDPSATLSAQIRTALIAVTSFTTFLRSLMWWIFLFSVVVAGVATFNAIKVKFTSVDIFGDHVESLSGWAFLVVLMSVFFALTCLILYVMSIYLSNIYSEIKNRPLYIIESVRRF